jgi:hypothetical protein
MFCRAVQTWAPSVVQLVLGGPLRTCFGLDTPQVLYTCTQKLFINVDLYLYCLISFILEGHHFPNKTDPEKSMEKSLTIYQGLYTFESTKI